MALLQGDPRPVRPGGSATGGTTEKEPTYLGVPDDYRVRRTPTSLPRTPDAAQGWIDQSRIPASNQARLAPYYKAGDESRPGSWGSDAILSIQQAMVVAGYLDPNDGFELFRWDPPTENAYKRLLEEANGAGLTISQMLARASESVRVGGGGSGGEDGGGGGGGLTIDPETGEIIEQPFMAPPLQLNLPNKLDVERSLRKSIIETTGEGWSSERISHFADQYLAELTRLQRDAYEQEVGLMEKEFRGEGTGGGTVTSIEAPSAEGWAEEEARERDPVGTGAQGVLDMFFENMGAFWQSPV